MPVDLATLQRAAEEAAWLVERGYPAGAVTAFVAKHRQLGGDDERLLACSARASAHYKHHIARELEPEDVVRRLLRVDTPSMLACAVAAKSGGLLLESPAGVMCDPGFERDGYRAPDDPGAAFEALATALASARPKQVIWFVDPSWDDGERIASEIGTRAPRGAAWSVERAPTERLWGAANLVSADPSLLDRCATWFNLTSRLLEGSPAQPLRL
jgi:hypothetical protein